MCRGAGAVIGVKLWAHQAERRQAAGDIANVIHLTWRPDMKQAWCLAASSTDATAKQLIGLYGRRRGIECSLRDSKDLRFGLGLATMHVKSPERRDRLWLINAFAVVLLTLLGAAGEALGYDRMLKTNTAKRRVHSLFRQGCMLYDLIPKMRDDWLRPLMQRFSEMLQQQPLFADVLGAGLMK